MPLLILLTYGSNCFVKIIVIEVSHIALLWKICSNKDLKMLKITNFKRKKPKTDDRYWWWIVFEKCARGLPPLKRKKLSKKVQERHDYILKNCMNQIGGGMIGDSNCIGTSLNGLRLNQPPNGLNLFQFLQNNYILIETIEQLILLVIIN